VALAIASTSLYVAGQSSGGGQIEKRDISTGALDPAFGTNGVIATSNAYNSIVLDGTSLFAGSATLLEKRTTGDGALDTSFGTNGILDTNSGTNLNAAALATDGSYLYVGGIDYFGTWEWRIEKRDLNDGAFVSAFGTAGAVTSQPSSQSAANQPALNALLVSGNYIYAGGFGFIPTPTDTWQWRIEKRYK
jgi:hypothetical protein